MYVQKYPQHITVYIPPLLYLHQYAVHRDAWPSSIIKVLDERLQTSTVV
jgi:hypothetical protein